MFPTSFIETRADENDTEETGIDFLFDYNTGQHIIKNCVLYECTQLQTVQQYIQNVLRTKANLYKVYVRNEDDVFGISVYDYIGTRTLPDGYLNSELKREVTELLLKHPLISEVKDWSGKRNKRGLDISFTTVLTDGTLLETSENVGGLGV
jgi:hypothetical protein